jgi:hypothetical protein
MQALAAGELDAAKAALRFPRLIVVHSRERSRCMR